MLAHIADLSDANEYVLGWTGQSLGRPWGDLTGGTVGALDELLSDYKLDAVGSIISATRTRPSGAATVSITEPTVVTQVDHNMTTDETVFMEAKEFPKQGATITAGSFVVGVAYEILTIGSTDFTLVGASANTVGLTFIATGAGVGTGTAGVRVKATDIVAGTPYNIEAEAIHTAGAFVINDWYTILTVGTTDFTLIGAASNTVGVSFKATGVGAGTGTAGNTGSTDYTLIGAADNAIDTQFVATAAGTGDGVVAETFGRGIPYYVTKLTDSTYTLASGPDMTTWLPATSAGDLVRMRPGQELVMVPDGYATPSVAVNEYVDAAYRLGSQLQLQPGYGKNISNLAIAANKTSVTAGAFLKGYTYEIATIGTTDFTLIGAASNTVGLSFVATGSGTGTGTAYLLYPAPKFTVYTSGEFVPTLVYEIVTVGTTDFVTEHGASSNTPGVRFTAAVAGTGTGTAKLITVLQPTTGTQFVRWVMPPEEPLIVAGSFVVGLTYQIESTGTTDFTLIGAAANTIGLVFIATGVGTGTGQAYRMDFSTQAYLMHEDFAWASYPQVRILTPYQPTEKDDWPSERRIPYPSPTADFGAGGRRITLPAPWTNPATPITDFADLAVFLEATLHEGVKGYGLSERTDSTAIGALTHLPHEISSISGDYWTFGVVSGVYTGVPIVKADVLVNARMIVDWEDGGVMKRSWVKIQGNTTTYFWVDSTSWLGDGNPGTGNHAKIKRYTVWVPWHEDSPHSYLPGEGFTYPNNDMSPYTDTSSAAGGVIMNRPRGNVFESYPGNIGELIVWGTRLSMAIGKRVNLVVLAVNGSQIAPSPGRNAFGWQGHCGWYDQADDWTWSPGATNGLWDRLKHLLTTCLPNAMAAEGNTKPIRVLGWVHSQGESDAMNDGARFHYGKSVRGLQTAIRNLCDTLKNADGSSYNPYTDEAKIPWIQPQIMNTPYQLKGTFTYYAGSVMIDGDSNHLVNNSILELVNADEFAGTIKCDDCPRNLPDAGHLSGTGHAIRAMRLAKETTQLIDYALGFGSAALVSTKNQVVDICNRALAMIGKDPAMTSMTENTEEASLCKLFYREARDSLLRLRQWNFALRRKALDELKMDDQELHAQWGYCYAVPATALSAFRVFPPDKIRAAFDDSVVLTLGYSASLVAAFDTTYGLSDDLNPNEVAQSLLPVTSVSTLKPQLFHSERSPDGGRRIYTNQEQATLQYVERVSDPSEYPPDFQGALTALLASKLAGALIRGPQSLKVADAMRQIAGDYMVSAANSDAFEQESEEDNFWDFEPDHLSFRNL